LKPGGKIGAGTEIQVFIGGPGAPPPDSCRITSVKEASSDMPLDLKTGDFTLSKGATPPCPEIADPPKFKVIIKKYESLCDGRCR